MIILQEILITITMEKDTDNLIHHQGMKVGYPEEVTMNTMVNLGTQEKRDNMKSMITINQNIRASRDLSTMKRTIHHKKMIKEKNTQMILTGKENNRSDSGTKRTKWFKIHKRDSRINMIPEEEAEVEVMTPSIKELEEAEDLLALYLKKQNSNLESRKKILKKK